MFNRYTNYRGNWVQLLKRFLDLPSHFFSLPQVFLWKGGLQIVKKNCLCTKEYQSIIQVLCNMVDYLYSINPIWLAWSVSIRHIFWPKIDSCTFI